MKSQKLIVIGAIVCLLVGAATGAMARNDCPNGTLVGGTFATIVIDEFKSCTVMGVSVSGPVVVTNADLFTMIGSEISGSIEVKNTISAAILNNVVAGNIDTSGNRYSTVVQNEVDGGQILVNDIVAQQQIAVVMENIVYRGGLQVRDNESADVKKNTVRGGDIWCNNNDRLDSFFNRAVWGTVTCSNIAD